MATAKGSKTVDGSATKAENTAWERFQKQVVMPFVSTEERVEDAYRTAFRAGRKLETDKAERKAKRK